MMITESWSLILILMPTALSQSERTLYILFGMQNPTPTQKSYFEEGKKCCMNIKHESSRDGCQGNDTIKMTFLMVLINMQLH